MRSTIVSAGLGATWVEAASARCTACSTSWWTAEDSRKRTSILVGCTLTSTRRGSISRLRQYIGWLAPCSTSAYAARTAWVSTLSRT